MGPIYRALGLTLGVIVHGMDPEARRAAYACDVTYCTNKEVAFDYLKDRIVLGREASGTPRQLARAYPGGAPRGGWGPAAWRGGERARQAVTAQRLFLRDKHYLVRDDKVQII